MQRARSIESQRLQTSPDAVAYASRNGGASDSGADASLHGRRRGCGDLWFCRRTTAHLRELLGMPSTPSVTFVAETSAGQLLGFGCLFVRTRFPPSAVLSALCSHIVVGRLARRLHVKWAGPPRTKLCNRSNGGALWLPIEKKDAVRRMAISRLLVLTTLSFLTFVLFFCSPALSQSQPLGRPPGEVNLPVALEPSLPAAAQFHGTVSGRIVDQTGNGIAGA